MPDNKIPKSHGRFDTEEDGEKFINIEEKEKKDKKQDEDKTLEQKKEQAKQVARQNLE